VRQVRAKKANASEPLMTCRKYLDGTETEGIFLPWDEPGSNLLTAQTVPGMEVARVWLRLWCGTWEPVASNVAAGLGQRPARLSKGDPQVAETARGRVPTRGAGTDRLVVAMKPVMRVERSRRVVRVGLAANHREVGGVGERTKAEGQAV
jgi:hypothetical protein